MIWRLDPTAKGQHTLHWFKNLLPNYLASTLLEGPLFGENRRYAPRLCVPAENRSGNEFPRHLAQGFRVLKRLSIISKDIIAKWDHTFVPPEPDISLEAAIYWGWFGYLYGAKMKRENLVDYLLVRDLFFLKVFRRHTRQRFPTVNDVLVEHFLGKYRIGTNWLTEGKNSQEEWFFMHKGADTLLKQWMTRLPSDKLVPSDLAYSHQKRYFYAFAEQKYYRSLDAAGRARARHYCNQIKICLCKSGDGRQFEIARSLFCKLHDEREREVASMTLQNIEIPKRKTGQLALGYKQAGFQNNEAVPFFVFSSEPDYRPFHPADSRGPCSVM